MPKHFRRVRNDIKAPVDFDRALRKAEKELFESRALASTTQVIDLIQGGVKVQRSAGAVLSSSQPSYRDRQVDMLRITDSAVMTLCHSSVVVTRQHDINLLSGLAHQLDHMTFTVFGTPISPANNLFLAR